MLKQTSKSIMYKIKFTPFTLFLLLSAYFHTPVNSIGGTGKWQILLDNTGVVAMHMALTHHNTVIMFDQVSSVQSGYQLRRRFNGDQCKGSRKDIEDSSCYAHSVEYDLNKNKIRPLNIETDPWCSSGSLLSNGTLIQTGGYGNGSRVIRYFESCENSNCDWKQGKKHLSEERWYASNLKLPENLDRVIILGGRNAFSYEFVPKTEPNEKSFHLPFLEKTYEKNEGGNNLYPVMHLSSDGNLFIFANRDSILFNYRRNKVVKKFPRIPGKGSRSYPSTGSSAILPLDHKNGFQKVEVMICGGSSTRAVSAAQNGNFLKGLKTCGRMVITGKKHKWLMENMPGARLMNDMLVLPTGHILLINGVKNGCAGWNYASEPSLQPYLYKPNKTLGKRFSILQSTKIARMYHSSAVLLPDGRVLVAGSNPNRNYTYHNVAHPTELRLQAFAPAYLGKEFDKRRPQNVSIYTGRSDGYVRYGEAFGVKFKLSRNDTEKIRKKGKLDDEVVFTAYAPPFNTHSMSMNQRLLILKSRRVIVGEDGYVNTLVDAPPSANVAPAGYYMITVVNHGIPSMSEWVRFVYA